jgi:hypothetical protein
MAAQSSGELMDSMDEDGVISDGGLTTLGCYGEVTDSMEPNVGTLPIPERLKR